ncbi:ABC transporter transmembrane domain-containing protein [Williamsia sp. SKLECPSW1]
MHLGATTGGGRVLCRTLRRSARRLIPGSAFLVVHQLCEAAVPILIGVIVDRAISTGSLVALIVGIAALAGVFLVLTAAFRLGARQLMVGIADESHHLRDELAVRSLGSADPGSGVESQHSVGELLSISTTDADNTSYLIDHVARVVASLAAVAACAVVLMVISVTLGVIVLVGIPLVVAGLQLTAPRIARRVELQQEAVGRASGLATDLVSGLRPLQGLGATPAASARYRGSSRTALAAALRAARIQNVHAGVSAAVGGLVAMTVAVVAVLAALDGGISIGRLITVIGLAQFLVEPFSVLAVVPSWVADARASANRVARVLADAPPSASPHDEIAVDVAPGEFVTVLAPAPRDADAVRGAWSATAATLPRGERRRRILVAPHESHVFTGTVGSNIAWSDPAPDAPDIAEVVAASKVDDIVATHPDGLARGVAERGASLSGGQRQRVALARALLAAPELLVLHDPTTAVDAVTEHAIARGIRDVRSVRGQTTVVVASSPPLLAVADRVVVVVDGRVTATGTHAHLVETDAGYREMVTR